MAVEKRFAKGESAPLAVFRSRKRKQSGVVVGNTSFESFLEVIAQLSPHDVVLSAIGGAQYAAFSTIQHPQPFDFYTKEPRGLVEKSAEIIPFRALSSHFAERISQDTGVRLKALRDATKARVVHLIPPPPKVDNEFIALYHEKMFAADDIVSRGISTPELRLKCWQLQRGILDKICRRYGIEVMPPPPKAMRAGFLHPRYYGADSTHANRGYGELVLRAVEAQFPGGA
jgi:hypothetical protein